MQVGVKDIMSFIYKAAETETSKHEKTFKKDLSASSSGAFQFSVITTLKYLNELENYIGELKSKISHMLFTAVNMNIVSKDPLSIFFDVNLGHAGVRTGRKIYGVDIASEQYRTEFIASANTLVGLAILILGAAYSLVSVYSSALTLIIMLLGMLAALLGSFTLKSEK